MFQIESLDKLVHELSRLPGVGPKSAQRLTHFLLEKKSAHSQQLRTGSFVEVEEKITSVPNVL